MLKLGGSDCVFCQGRTDDDAASVYSPSLGAWFHESCAAMVVEIEHQELIEDARVAIEDRKQQLRDLGQAV